VIHDDMPYDIQGPGHRDCKVAKMAQFKVDLHQYACSQKTNSEL